jgi:hypothetical protein
LNFGKQKKMSKSKEAFVTGGAGFIGSNLVEELVSRGYETTVYDNLSVGKVEFIKYLMDEGKCRFIHADSLDLNALSESIKHHDVVFHLAANSDIAKGEEITVEGRRWYVEYALKEGAKAPSKLQIIDQKNERPEVECLGEEIEQSVEDVFSPRSLSLIRKRLSFAGQLGKNMGEVRGIFRPHAFKDPDAFVFSLVKEGDKDVGQ